MAVALCGRTLRGRHGAAMLLDMGMQELVTYDVPSYVRVGVRLATDDTMRAAMRERLLDARETVPTFTDSRRFAGRIGAVYERWTANA